MPQDHELSGEPPSDRSGDPPRDPVAMRETYDMYSAMAYVLAGPLTFGPVGWLGDHFLGTAVLLPLGILAGMVLSLYYVWFRYGTR